MNFFHVSTQNHELGTILPPGRFGAMHRNYRPGGPMPTPQNIAEVLWEVALESARKAVAPDKPSRLDSIFAADDLEMAIEFGRLYRPAGYRIFRIEPTRSDVRIHRADFMAISDRTITGAYADYMAAGAMRYWTQEPDGLVEVLLPCSIKIVEVA